MSVQTAATAPTEARTTPIKVRKIGHLVYEVSDVERSRKFWTEMLGFTVSDTNEFGMVFLRTAADHHTIALMPGKAPRRATEGLKVDHLALELASIDELLAAREFLKSHGVPVVWEGRRGPGGNYSVHCHDPDGYDFELYCEMDQVDARGVSRPSSQWSRAGSLEEAIAKPLPKSW
ncbi:MAG TPA: VOC family protein [Stellaceae bacterium]|nr:VOC family protein [Stellaceae bacterium]